MIYPVIELNKNEERRLLNGHLWIYSNEIDTRQQKLTSFEKGQLVTVCDYTEQPFGIGYINPQNLLCIRLLSRDSTDNIDQAFFVARLNQCKMMRERYFQQPYYRLVYGESDLLPGLIIDRFGDDYVVQINTAGMEALRDTIIAALNTSCAPKRIILKADTGHRELEGLPLYCEMIQGNATDTLTVHENNTVFNVPLLNGQKTGWFYDHRDNRHRINQLAKNKRILDLFSYVGGWGIQAAKHGAAEVCCIDSSQEALALVHDNAKANQVETKVTTQQGDVFSLLDELAAANEKFDIIILDPPALVKKRKDLPQGLRAYHQLNRRALRLLNPQGLLASASCSMHVTSEDLQEAIRKATQQENYQARIIAQGHQAIDHPIHPAIPETNYLKTCFVDINY